MKSKYVLEKPDNISEMMFGLLIDEEGNIPDVTKFRQYQRILDLEEACGEPGRMSSRTGEFNLKILELAKNCRLDTLLSKACREP